MLHSDSSIDYIPEFNDFSTFVYILLKFCKTVLLGLFMEDNAALKLLIFPDSARVYLLLKAVGLELSAMHQWIYCCPDSSPREYVLLSAHWILVFVLRVLLDALELKLAFCLLILLMLFA